MLAHRPDLQQLIDQGMQAAERQASVPLRARQLHETIEQVRTRLKPPAKPADAGTAPATAVPPTPPPITPPPMSPGPSLPMSPSGTSPAAPVGSADTLWKRLGGEDGVTKIVEDWLNLAAADRRVNLTRGDKYKLDKQKEAELKQRFVAYLSSITPGGTVVPTSTRTMVEVHKGMNITAAEFDAFVSLLKTSLEKNNVAARDVDEVLKKVNETRKDIVGG
jgi:hemoglobin